MIPSDTVQSSSVNQKNLYNSELSSLKFWHAGIALKGGILKITSPSIFKYKNIWTF